MAAAAWISAPRIAVRRVTLEETDCLAAESHSRERWRALPLPPTRLARRRDATSGARAQGVAGETTQQCYNSDMGRVTVEAVLTTTHPVEAYGGIQLSRKVLVDLADAVRDGKMPLQWNHDLRRPFDAIVLETGVREREDGFEEAWALLEVEEQAWAEWQAQLRELNAPGGMSFSLGTPLRTIDGIGETDLPLLISADAAHFSDEVILEAAQKVAALGPTSASRYYQFAFEPTAKVVLEYGAALLAAVPPGLLANYLFEMVKPFLRLPSRSGKPTTFEFHVSEAAGTRSVAAHLETASEDVAKQAIEAFGDVAGTPGTYEFRSDGLWARLDRDEG